MPPPKLIDLSELQTKIEKTNSTTVKYCSTTFQWMVTLLTIESKDRKLCITQGFSLGVKGITWPSAFYFILLVRGLVKLPCLIQRPPSNHRHPFLASQVRFTVWFVSGKWLPNQAKENAAVLTFSIKLEVILLQCSKIRLIASKWTIFSAEIKIFRLL